MLCRLKVQILLLNCITYITREQLCNLHRTFSLECYPTGVCESRNSRQHLVANQYNASCEAYFHKINTQKNINDWSFERHIGVHNYIFSQMQSVTSDIKCNPAGACSLIVFSLLQTRHKCVQHDGHDRPCGVAWPVATEVEKLRREEVDQQETRVRPDSSHHILHLCSMNLLYAKT